MNKCCPWGDTVRSDRTILEGLIASVTASQTVRSWCVHFKEGLWPCSWEGDNGTSWVVAAKHMDKRPGKSLVPSGPWAACPLSVFQPSCSRTSQNRGQKRTGSREPVPGGCTGVQSCAHTLVVWTWSGSLGFLGVWLSCMGVTWSCAHTWAPGCA